MRTSAFASYMAGSARLHRPQDPIGGRVPSISAPRVRGDLAWEFLRRDPGYRRAWSATCEAPGDRVLWTRASLDFGLQAPADPRRDAGAAAVLWRSEIAPAVVVDLEPVRSVGVGAIDLRSMAWLREGGGSVSHLRAPLGLQLDVRDADPSRPLALVVPLGGDFAVRLRTMMQLRRVLAGQAAPQDFTPQQLTRLHRALQALDAVDAGMSRREVAVLLFGADALAREPWKTSSLRDTTQRLIRTAQGLKRGGYRRLLLTRPR